MLEVTFIASRLETCGDTGCTSCTVGTCLRSVIGASQETIRQVVRSQIRKITTIEIEAPVDLVRILTGHIIGTIVLGTGGSYFRRQIVSGGGSSYADIGACSHDSRSSRICCSDFRFDSHWAKLPRSRCWYARVG